MDLTDGWRLATTGPDAVAGPDGTAELEWTPATVPGTAAAALGDDGRDFDAQDYWFRCCFRADPERLEVQSALELDGLATVGEAYLNGEQILAFASMWEAHAIDVTGRLRSQNELLIVCRALSPRLLRRRRPAARWRTRVVNSGNLRWWRTMIFGRSPGFAPGPAPVGPWRPVRLVDRDLAAVDALHLRTRLDGADGVLTVSAVARGSFARAQVSVAGHVAGLERQGHELHGELRIPAPARWWPHTHGEPALHEVVVALDGRQVARRRVGFRELAHPADIAADGLSIELNGVPVFVRGAVWTPADLVTMSPGEDELRGLLQRAREAGMNMLRVTGTGAYETARFHELCDELGILVWQDLMFANLDYPLTDEEFNAGCQTEARTVLARLGGHPSLAVVCGNSEVEQQPAMMGLEPGLGRDPFWEETLPDLIRAASLDCAYLPSTPFGGTLPFHPRGGVSHYFGVSGFFAPPQDARRAEISFASECLAFANIPDEVEVPVHHPRWKQGVQRDAGTGWDLGAGWDFDDVRDHYLALLFGVDPVQLRRNDLARYLELGRFASGEVMAELMGEWRRAASPCSGALVLWFKDMLPGAGLGVLDHHGRPKVAYHHLRRALAPVAVWMTDEGVGGVAVHIANDTPRTLTCRLRVATYRDLEVHAEEAEHELVLAAHQTLEHSVEGLLGHFVDAAWAYRFGPPAQDAIIVGLESADSEQLISQAVHFPAGRPLRREPAARMNVAASASAAETGVELCLESARLLYGVRLRCPGFTPDDDAFTLEPGRRRTVPLRALVSGTPFSGGTLSALNLADEVPIQDKPT